MRSELSAGNSKQVPFLVTGTPWAFAGSSATLLGPATGVPVKCSLYQQQTAQGCPMQVAHIIDVGAHRKQPSSMPCLVSTAVALRWLRMGKSRVMLTQAAHTCCWPSCRLAGHRQAGPGCCASSLCAPGVAAAVPGSAQPQPCGAAQPHVCFSPARRRCECCYLPQGVLAVSWLWMETS